MSKPKLSMGAITAIVVAILTALAVANKGHSEPVSYPLAEQARFTVEVVGSGTDVILIPGLGSSADVWAATVEALKPNHRIHVLNIAGFAGVPAGANAEGEVIAPSVEALHDYIVSQGLKKPVVMGHSMGGLMTLMLGIAHPEDAGKLIVVDALPFYSVLFDPGATVENVKSYAVRYRDMVANMPEAQFAAMQQQLIPAHKPAWGETVVGWSLTSDRKVFAQALYDDLLTDTRADLPKIKAPLVVFYPWTSASAFAAEATDGVYAAQYANASGVKLIRIDDSSHFIMLDQPDVFHAKLIE